MNYLLDTHAFIWSVFDPDRLGKKTKLLLENAENAIFVSVVSFWEISLKNALGKLELVNVNPDSFPDIAKELEFEVLPLAPGEAASFYQLPRTGPKDPFDRMIIWQAIRQKLTLLSRDKALKVYKEFGLKVIW